MNNLKTKLKKQGGFTLVEMLIVVAIIAILIAVSIPMVNSSLEKAREATDDANERAAIGIAMVEFMTAEKKGADSDSGIGTDGGDAYYVITEGKGSLVKDKPTDDSFKYGKGTEAGQNTTPQAGLGIKVSVDDEGNVTTGWE